MARGVFAPNNPTKSSRSMSADIETDGEDEFAADLYHRLQEEAKYQESLGDITAWSRGLICL